MSSNTEQQSDRLVECKLVFTRPKHDGETSDEGDSFPVTLALGFPVDGNPGSCVVYFDGYRRPMNIRGMDGFHALCSAIKFMRDTMLLMEKQGWRFNVDCDSVLSRFNFDSTIANEVGENCDVTSDDRRSDELEAQGGSTLSVQFMFAGL